MERDIRGQAGLVRTKPTKNRGDYLMPVLLQERGKQIPRTIGLPCAVYQDEGRHGGKVYQVRLRPVMLILLMSEMAILRQSSESLTQSCTRRTPLATQNPLFD